MKVARSLPALWSGLCQGSALCHISNCVKFSKATRSKMQRQNRDQWLALMSPCAAEWQCIHFKVLAATKGITLTSSVCCSEQIILHFTFYASWSLCHHDLETADEKKQQWELLFSLGELKVACRKWRKDWNILMKSSSKYAALLLSISEFYLL